MGADHDRLDEMTTRYHRDSSRLESLKAMAEHYDGYGNGIRKVMELKGRNPGIRGVIADLMDVPEKYETAIETALGGSLRNVVTDNETTAKYLIEYLKAGRFGRATFLPLTSIRGREFRTREALREAGVVGIASELVTCDEEYLELKKYLLGRTLVVDGIDHAIALGRKYRHSLYMVTLAGESFAPGGSITGGTFRNRDNLLGRKREIEELEAGTKRLKKEAEAAQAAIDEKKERRNVLRERSQSIGEERQKLRVRLGVLETSKKQAEEQKNVARLNAHALEKEKSDISREMEDIRAKSDAASNSMETSKVREEEASQKEADLRARETQLRAEREKQAVRLEEVHVRSAALSQTQGFRTETLERLVGEMQELAEEEKEIRGRIASSKDESAVKEDQIAEVEKTIAESLAKEEEDAAKREGLRTKKESLTASHRDFFAKRDELSEHISALDREIFRLTAQKEKFEAAREARTSYMFSEYNLTPSEIRKLGLPDRRTDVPGLKRDIASARDAIRKLGAVNVNAIEEYKEVSERYEFLTRQHEDLVKSEETLNGIIKELDEGMRRQFSENFALIRLEFDKAFRELFGGGHGTLELDADADILEAGISIIAHPPGKKLQNMMQLSGGEKALTAIALLFAIQNRKPSPFCLLDEIEAALDESNVGRFAAYLHKLTKNTQFIIITHRRGTMTAADRLYGITMQEKGVSTLVSVSLIEDKLTG